MAVPVLSLNLAPRPNLWREHHLALGWTTLGLGLTVLLGVIGLTWRAYHQANRAGRDAVSLTEEAQRAATKERQIQSALQDIDASREQSRWKLAERILLERALPWSRLTAELEQCMVPDMRLKAIQRTRSSGQQVVMKLKGEAQTREAEAAFVEELQAAPIFTEVVLEREAERQGGGWEFELSLPTAAVPPPFRQRAVKTKAAATAIKPPVSAPHPAPARIPAPMAKPPQPRAAALSTPILKSAPAPIIQAQPAPSGTRQAPLRSGPARRRDSRRSSEDPENGGAQ